MSKTKDEPTGSMLPLPVQFLASWLAVWLGRVLQQEVDYLMAENRVLRERLGGKKLRLTVAERRRLAVLGKQMGRKALAKVATIARPETILRWYSASTTARPREAGSDWRRGGAIEFRHTTPLPCDNPKRALILPAHPN